MAAGQHIWKRKLLHAGCSCCLNDANIGNIMGRHGIKPKLELIHGSVGIMCLHNAIGNRALFCLHLIRILPCQLTHFCGFIFRHNLLSVHQIYAAII